MPRQHSYRIALAWTGDRGTGTSRYDAYGRTHEIRAPGKPPIAGSSDPSFRGDAACWNPEELLVASLSACHQLWYLHLCADAGIIVIAYGDLAEGMMVEADDGAGQFTRVVLRPRVTISPASDADLARSLHEAAHEKCFIARSMAFPVDVEPSIAGAPAPAS